jgi:CHAT domain-containing protein/Tfp pilus assembly protein PilF
MSFAKNQFKIVEGNRQGRRVDQPIANRFRKRGLFQPLGFAMLVGLAASNASAQRAEVYEINKRAVQLLQKGEFAEAVVTAERAVKLAETTLGPDHPGLAAALTNLGETYVEVGRYAEAESPMRRAIEIAQSSWGIGPVDLGAMLNNLGKLYAVQGRYDDAEKFYLRALALKDSIGKPHVAMATWLNNIALLYIRQRRYADAWAVAERGLVLLPDRSNSDPAVAETFSLMGWLKLREGNYGDAQRLIEWSLDIRQRKFGSDHPETASSIHNLGMLYEKRGLYKEAEPLLLRALAIREKSLPADHPEVGESLMDAGLHFYASGTPDRAQSYFKRAFDNLAARFDQYFTFMSEEDRLAFLDTVADAFPIYYSFCLSYRDRNPDLTQTMFDLVLLQKGMVAVSMRALLSRMGSEVNQQSLTLVNQLRERRTLIANLRRDPTANETVSRLKQEANGLERQLARMSTAFAQRQRSARVRWDAVRGALAQEEAAVEYVAFDFHNGKTWTGARVYVALVLRPADAHPTLVALGDTQKWMGAPFNDYRKQAGLERDSTVPDKPGFHETFWQPLEQWLAKAKRVYLSPDGALNQVAWAVIQTPNQLLLTEQLDLRLVSSTRDLLEKKGGSPKRTAMLMGNPDFGGADADVKFQSLPGTHEELAPLNRMLRDAGWQVAVFEGKEATETRLKSIRQPGILHIATHGFFEPAPADRTVLIADPMLRSGLALAGANMTLKLNQTAEREDGILTALEASTLNLQDTEIVVLSACETGVGQLTLGEGVFGLRRAFQEAGADAVLMSMWKVPDEETRALMTLFYRKWLSGLDKQRALREAQLELRRKIREDWGRDRPLLWGAFVLVGR